MNTKIHPMYKKGYDYSYDPKMTFEHNTYTNNISQPAMVMGNNPEYDYERRFIFTSSRYRDRTLYPDSGHFSINLPDTATDLVCLELAAGTIPAIGAIQAAPYLFMQIEDLNHIKGSNGQDYFGILTLHTSNNNTFYHLDKSSTNKMPYQFNNAGPKRYLKSLTISLYYPDGSPVLFGDESDLLTPIDEGKQTSFTFEIRSRIPCKKGFYIDSRNVY